MYCKYCGKQIEESAKFCQHCGGDLGAAANQDHARQFVGQAAPEAAQQPIINVVNQNTNVNNLGIPFKKKWTAFWLCLLLGEFGIHRFYVGKVFTGIIWMFTFGLCGIGWLLDLLVILCGGFKDKHGFRLI